MTTHNPTTSTLNLFYSWNTSVVLSDVYNVDICRRDGKTKEGFSKNQKDDIRSVPR